MIGAIAGGIIGLVYQKYPITTADFPLFDPGSRFTDDTVMMVAVAHAVPKDFAGSLAKGKYRVRRMIVFLPYAGSPSSHRTVSCTILS